jgi:hypothetical protein
LPEVATPDYLGGVRGEDEVWFVGVQGEGCVVGAVCGMGSGAVEAFLAACGREDDEVADVEGRGLGGGAEFEDTACA